MSEKERTHAPFTIIALLLVLFVMPSCSRQKPSAESTPSASPESFASPEDAAAALVQAAKSDNREAMLTIFGAASKSLIYSGDAQEDKASFAGFVSDYDTMHRWRKLEDGSELLLTGADNKTFPIPLRKNDTGKWYFDTKAGEQEILSRRVGRNELAAIDVCATIATAQFEYFAQKHDGVQQFAQKFISDQGQQNGLYWPYVEGQPHSPLGPLVAFATGEGYKIKPDSHQPFHGYYFRMLDKQGPGAKGGAKNYVVNGRMTGGFAVVASPAQYGDSGVMTFMINQDGVVYEKDLGKTTTDAAEAITEFNPDKTWKPLEPK